MFRKYLLPLFAVAGVLTAVYAVMAGQRELPPAPPVAAPAQAPFQTYVAGAGLVEASTENIAIGTLEPGVVTRVYIKVGDHVKAGDPLFTVDDRQVRATVAVRQAAVLQAQRQIDKLKNSPRPEDLPPLEAKVSEMQATLADRQREFSRLERLGEVARLDEREKAKFSVSIGEAMVNAAQAELTRAKAGTWKYDLDIAEAELQAAVEQLNAAKVELDRLTVKAPVDATVLQVKVRPGEYASAGALQQPLIVIGDTDTLHVRVDVDENDAWRLKPGAKARASLRGNSELATDVEFVRVEPFVIPKRSLTGESTERVDTRVLQVLFKFDRSKLNAYVGQQMDVFIEAAAIGK
jgi:VCBS repeat-containing protein